VFIPVNDSGATQSTVNGTPLSPHAAAEDTRVRPEFLLPHRPAEHDDRVAAGHLISSALNARPMVGSTP